MKTTANGTTAAQVNNTNRENLNAANTGASYNKIDDFGAKIGGARKDQYAAAREWAEKLADITAEALTKAGGVSKLVRLPNLESMAAAGAITADQARAALIIWRGIERKPQGIYKADRWAERTRARLEAAAAIITGTEPTADNVADIIKAARESAEFAVITAAQWPAEPFTFGNYTVSYSLYSEPRKLRIIGARYYRGEASTDPADIVRQLREMTAADAEKAAESRARGPRLGVYHTSDYTRYFVAVENKCEIVLKVCDTYQEATEAARNERAELLAKYENLKSFPALRRSWNRPRVGKEWHAEDVTPEQFAAVLPFRGVEFGNWLNQDERAALLNSAFDGFHDLADLLGIPAAAVSLGGMLNFSFATRGHAGSAAHFDSCYNTINLNKRNGAGCMAHEWLHACDHFAAVLAGRGSCTSWGEAFATECNKESNHPADIAARELVAAIRKMDYYTRSKNYQLISGKSQGGADYYTQPCELAARGFEGVVLYLLNCAGGCSDFLVNLQSWRDFERDDAGHRRDCYPYPSDAEAAALVPYYVAFFRALFGSCQVSEKAAEGVAAATLQAQQEKAEADRRAQEKAEQERKESEERRAARRAELDRKAEEQRKENERKAAEVKAKAEATRAAIVERLTAAHFDTIATDCDAAAVYFAAHLEGEIYTGKADIKSDPAEIAATVQAAPVACLQYKYIHNAKRVICHRWQVASVRSNKRTARELLESLQPSEVRAICRAFVDFESADNWQKAARIWSDTQRTNEAQKAAQKPANEPTANEPTESNQEAADGLTMEKYSEKATVIRGYNADQLAELLAMGGKEWRNLKGGKGVIFSTRRHADELAAWMEQQQGEGTTAPAADQPAESVPAATLQEAGEIETPAETLPEWATEGARVTILRNGEQLRGYITEIHKAFRGARYLCTFHELGTLFNIPVNVSDCAPVEEPAAVLPEWLKVGARVRTRGRYMLSTRSRRPEWVEGEEMEVTEITAEWVSLKSDTARESVSTANAAAELTPIYSASEKLGEAVRQWAANEYAATHHGATLTDWDKAHPAPVEWCKPGQVFKLAGRQIAGRDVYAIITKLGNDCFFYVGNFGSCSEHLTAYNCQQWENLQPVEIMHEDTPKFAKMFQKFHDIRKAWEADGVKIWQEREDKERTAAPLQEPAAIAASDEEGAPLTEPNRDGLPEWLHVGTRFCLLDFVTGKPTAVRYTCAAIDYENKTVTIPEARDSFRNGSTVYRWDAFHWATFAPVTDDTDPTPDPSGEGVGICHSYETGAPCYSTSEKLEPTADPLADIIREAKQQEARTVSGLNYGPIKYLRNNVLYANNGRTTAENMTEYEANLHRVTDPDTYAAYLISSYDVFVDETQVFCDLRRAFPSLTFAELCRLIRDHMGENQQGNGIAAALVPDCVILAGGDEYTRRKFKERHDRYNTRRTDEKDGYNGQQWARWYDRESLALHLLLSEELFYIWENRRAARALDYLQESYPDATADELQAVFMKHAEAVREIYG